MLYTDYMWELPALLCVRYRYALCFNETTVSECDVDQYHSHFQSEHLPLLTTPLVP